MRTLGSVAAVIAAIDDDAAVEIERIEREAEGHIAAFDEPESGTPFDPGQDGRVEDARAAARTARSETEWDASVADLQERERWIAQVAADARRALEEERDPSWTQAWIRQLAIEAAAALPPGDVVAVVPAGTSSSLGEAWAAEVGRAIGRTVSVEAGPLSCGCLVRLADSPIAYDNSLEARERRTELTWRHALAALYTRLVVESPATAPAMAARASDP